MGVPTNSYHASFHPGPYGLLPKGLEGHTSLTAFFMNQSEKQHLPEWSSLYLSPVQNMELTALITRTGCCAQSSQATVFSIVCTLFSVQREGHGQP
jgi:hypothetical protein